MSQRPVKKSVLVTGANGFIGSAVCRAFVRVGWRVYGIVRRPEAAYELSAAEVIPVQGSISEDLSFLDSFLEEASTPPFNVVISCTEEIPFATHFGHILAILIKVGTHAKSHGVRPLVLMSSGCKDYGTTGRHGDAGLVAHTEKSPLNPPQTLKERCTSALEVFDHADLFDAAVIRPTPLFGYGGSYYGPLIEAMSRFLEKKVLDASDGPIRLPGHGNTIIHGCHVDDCAEAYLALVLHADRSQINGQCFNISGYRYETLAEIYDAFATEYGISADRIVVTPDATEVDSELQYLSGVIGFSQWVDSTKIRNLTGWTDTRMLFSENLHAYTRAYEAISKAGDQGVSRIRDRYNRLMTAGIH
ncbi:NAD(P)-binding protein [Xylariaceae sp. FL0255]|nr:NAD(P)-binding protein [Xylariaceae sp. FL0255]